MNHKDGFATEEVLSGGRLTAGVVRIGDTVRRPTKASSLFSARLLTHLANVGFDGAPRFIGRDKHDRDVLSFIPGWVPVRFQRFENEQVWAAGKLLQRFHAATANSELVEPGQVVCHHDPGPNNVVFQEGRPCAFIDFDLAAPGDPLDDIGYMAWTWCVSSRPDRSPAASQAEQVRLLAEAYGLTPSDRSRLVDAMLNRQELNIQFWKTYSTGKTGMLSTPKEQIDERIHWTEQEMAYTRASRATFERALE